MNYPIRVLVLETVMDRGGAETMTMNYLRNFDRNIIQYDFLVHRPYKGAYEDEITKLGGKIMRICPPYPQNFFKYKKEFKRILKEHPEYQIIHVNMMHHGLFAYYLAKKMGIKVRICHAHISNGNSKQVSLRDFVLFIYKMLSRRYYNEKFACGEEAAKWIFGKNNTENVFYMKNAVDTDIYKYDPVVEKQVREEFGLDNKYVIGHVGRFFEQKNHKFIIKAFYEVTKLDDNAVLMLVGGGEEDDKNLNEIKTIAKNLGIEDKVIFTGVRTDVNRIVQAFNVFILPSLCEGLPMVMIEAQTAGLPCIISENVPIECKITDNVNVVPLTDGEEKWAKAILKYKNFKKNDTSDLIKKAGYDIKNNALKLQNKYIKMLEENS